MSIYYVHFFENLQAQSIHVGSHESFAGLADGV